MPDDKIDYKFLEQAYNDASAYRSEPSYIVVHPDYFLHCPIGQIDMLIEDLDPDA